MRLIGLSHFPQWKGFSVTEAWQQEKSGPLPAMRAWLLPGTGVSADARRQRGTDRCLSGHCRASRIPALVVSCCSAPELCFHDSRLARGMSARTY